VNSITAGQEWLTDVEASDLALLADALQEAVDAVVSGRLLGPAVDEVAWRRATRRAFRADVARSLRTVSADALATTPCGYVLEPRGVA
jgi:hypothetical protein